MLFRPARVSYNPGARTMLSSLSLFQATPAQRRTLLAAALGWMLDAFDVMLYALVLARVMTDLGMTKTQAGTLNTLTLIASGIGGVLFGFFADRIGRKKALMLSILTYSVCSFGSGLSHSLLTLAVFRFLLGLGMGGEWNTGAALVAETWPTSLRAKAIAIVQSSWAIGFALAALVVWLVLLRFDWRAVFFVGVLPALLLLWIRKDVPESQMWLDRRQRTSSTSKAAGGRFVELFGRVHLRNTMALLLLNFFGMFAWWGLFTWLPAYLTLSPAEGGRGLAETHKTLLLVVLNLTGMFPGYLSFGWMADRLGRRKAFMLYTTVAALLVPIYAMANGFWTLLLVGTPMAFFGTGFFSGSALIGSELFPTDVRARALGFTYNGARTLSAVSPAVVGWVAEKQGLAGALFLSAVAFLLAAWAAALLPETRGQELQ